MRRGGGGGGGEKKLKCGLEGEWARWTAVPVVAMTGAGLLFGCPLAVPWMQVVLEEDMGTDEPVVEDPFAPTLSSDWEDDEEENSLGDEDDDDDEENEFDAMLTDGPAGRRGNASDEEDGEGDEEGDDDLGSLLDEDD